MSDQEKICSACGTIRHFDSFAIDQLSPDGHTSVCVACSQPELWTRVGQLEGEFLALDALRKEVIKAVVNGGEKMKPYLNFTTKEEKHEPWFWALCEYMYLYLHLVHRIASNKLSVDKQKLIRERLFPSLVNTFIHEIFDFLSDEEREELCADAGNASADVDAEYSRCLKLISAKDPFDNNCVFSILASRLTSLSNNENDPLKLVEILSMSFDAYQELGLESLVLDLGRVIRAHSATNLSDA